MKKISWGCAIIGLINIVLSILNAISVFLSLSLKTINDFVRLILPFQGTEISLSAIYQIFPKSQPFIKSFLSPFIGYTISIILLISGIGVILRKPWGRSLSCIYAISMIVISSIGLPLALTYFMIEFIRMTRNPSFIDWIVWVGGGALIYIVIFFVALLYPIILLIFFSRPRVKEMFICHWGEA